MSCGCQDGRHASSVPGQRCGCHAPSLRGYRWHLSGLAALSPADAANQVFPTAKIRSGAGHNQSIWNSLQLAAQTGQMVGAGGEIAYIPGTADCAAASGVPTGAQNDLKLTQTASGLALTGLQLATSAGVLAAPFTMGISIAVSAIVGLFSTLINHHAQAVRQEQSVLCSAVPAANNYLKIISQAVASGLSTPQQGIDALNSLLSDFESAVSSIRHGTDPTSSGECNAACVMQSELHAIVLLMQSQFQDLINAADAAAQQAPIPMAAAPVQAVVPSRPNTISPVATAPASSYATFYSPGSTVPTPMEKTSTSWLPIAALIVGGFFVLRGI
jgi:hypothetical protein